MIQQGWRQILDLLFPRACMLCRRLVVEARYPSLCVHCRDELSPIESGCLRCGAPLPSHELLGRDAGVGTCQGGDPEIHTKRGRVGCAICRSQRWDFG
ncbi:MAG: double zinc ribbon domain-containing protein, partial [Pirellula sp.]